MAKVFGTATIAWNGRELQSVEDSASLSLGLPVGKVRKGPKGFVGASVVVNTSELECEVIPTDDFDPTDMAGGVEATVRFFEDVSGIEWVIARMVLTDDPKLSEGSGSKWSLKFEGGTAEKV